MIHEESALFEAYGKSRCVGLRNMIAEKYLYIPSIVANRFSGRGVETDDLYQVASLALLKAVERYSPERGVKFASYATPTVVGEVKNYFRDRMRAIRIPRRGAEMARRIFAARQMLEQQFFRPPTPDEIAAHIGISVEKVLEAHEIASAMSVASIEATSANDDFSLEKTFAVQEAGYEAFENEETAGALLAVLTDEERAVIKGRYYESLSQRNLAAKMHVSQMTVSRIERRAIEKMKNAGGIL